jgi:UDP-N-acetylmuramoyl-L-alanyl-D-glutamate--2,6-diaminopimelate ligase
MIKGVTSNSKDVLPGFVFVAIKGLNHDGHDFIDQAIRNGASRVYGEKDIKNLKYIKVKDSRQKLGELASDFYGNPSSKLKVIGVTGTKGKTTTSHLIYHILTGLGQKTGLVSSITTPGFHVTTPDVITLNRTLRQMQDDGCEYAVLEVSSHGIDQGRIAGINFEVGVLTNIAPEHLDYHKSFEAYKKIKLSFINSAKIKVISPETTKLNVLPGEFNNLNAQVAISAVEMLGFDPKKALETLNSFNLPEGRMEEVNTGRDFRLFIDFAHTPESLEASLTYLKSITKGRLISVFGCAGERDTAKRPKMGEISTRIADVSVFTAEDPRSEDISSILGEMELGAVNKKFVSIPERSEAIAFALNTARTGDVIGIFGKGHEKSMAFKGYEHPWSDKKIAGSLLKGGENISTIILAAGMGSRMKSDIPKVLMEICGRPMISYTLENLRLAGISDVVVVVRYQKEMVVKRMGGAVKFGVQKILKGGTADAAKTGLTKVSEESKILVVINGDDSAFYKPSTIQDVVENHIKNNAVLTFVSLMREDPFGLGRVVRDSKGNVAGIVEEKDATASQRKINEVNDGLYVFDKDWFTKNIANVKKSPQGEYYLVDLISLAVLSKNKVEVYKLPDSGEWQGINTPDQLKVAQEKMEERLEGHNV